MRYDNKVQVQLKVQQVRHLITTRYSDTELDMSWVHPYTVGLGI